MCHAKESEDPLRALLRDFHWSASFERGLGHPRKDWMIARQRGGQGNPIVVNKDGFQEYFRGDHGGGMMGLKRRDAKNWMVCMSELET